MKIKKTLAAVLVETHKPLVLAQIDLPSRLSFGQVLVQILYTTICGAQLNEIDAAKGDDKYLPHLLGHEASALVLDIGEGVRSVRKGDKVVLHWRKSDGLESSTPVYSWNKKKVNAGWVTTFQKYAVVSENRVTTIAKDFDMKIAPLFGCAVTTAMGVINNDAQLKIGQSLVVFGCGGVGLNIIQMGQMVSGYPIIGIDIVDSKLKMAKKFGAGHVLNGKDQKLEEKIKAIVGVKGADVVIDTTGSARVIERCYSLTHPDGRTILVGVPKKGDNISIYSLPLHFKKVLKGSHGGSSSPQIDIPRLIALYQAGKLKLSGLITHEFPLKKINEAIEIVRSGIAGRVVVKL